MQRAKTKAEYQATGMLLGLRYSQISHVYYGDGYQVYIDPDTLEPILPGDTIGDRYHRNRNDTYADGTDVKEGRPTFPAPLLTP